MWFSKIERAQYTHSILINAPIENIWNLITNVNEWPSWNPNVSYAKLNGKFLAGNAFSWKSGVNIISTIEKVEYLREIIWSGKAIGTKAFHTWFFEQDDKGVKVTTSESFDGWLVRLMPKIMGRSLEQSLIKQLNHLKLGAESFSIA